MPFFSASSRREETLSSSFCKEEHSYIQPASEQIKGPEPPLSHEHKSSIGGGLLTESLSPPNRAPGAGTVPAATDKDVVSTHREDRGLGTAGRTHGALYCLVYSEQAVTPGRPGLRPVRRPRGQQAATPSSHTEKQ